MQFNSSKAVSSKMSSTLLCSLDDFSIELPITKIDYENADTAGFTCQKNKTFYIRARVNGNNHDDFFSAHKNKKHVHWTSGRPANSELFHYEETLNDKLLLKTCWNTYVTFDRKIMSFVQCTHSTPQANRMYINVPLCESDEENQLSEEDNQSCNSEESLIESMTLSDAGDVSELSEQSSYVSNPLESVCPVKARGSTNISIPEEYNQNIHLDEIMDDTIVDSTLVPTSVVTTKKKPKSKTKQTTNSEHVKKPIPIGLKAYQAFAKSKRALVKNKNPDFKFSDINKELGSMWKNTSEQDKKYWFDIVTTATNPEV